MHCYITSDDTYDWVLACMSASSTYVNFDVYTTAYCMKYLHYIFLNALI